MEREADIYTVRCVVQVSGEPSEPRYSLLVCGFQHGEQHMVDIQELFTDRDRFNNMVSRESNNSQNKSVVQIIQLVFLFAHKN